MEKKHKRTLKCDLPVFTADTRESPKERTPVDLHVHTHQQMDTSKVCDKRLEVPQQCCVKKKALRFGLVTADW